MAAAYLNAPNISVSQFCTKVPLASRQHGIRAIRKLKSEGLISHGVGEMNVYRCAICGQLHLGHR